MPKRRKKMKLTIVIRDADIKIRKAAVRPVLKLRDKTKYSRQENKRFSEQLPDRDGRGVFLPAPCLCALTAYKPRLLQAKVVLQRRAH